MQITGEMDISSSGRPSKLQLNEDGIDFAAVSLQPQPAGEYVPLLFTARNMDLRLDGSTGQLRGEYDVPSYRGTTFMDPKVCMYGLQTSAGSPVHCGGTGAVDWPQHRHARS